MKLKAKTEHHYDPDKGVTTVAITVAPGTGITRTYVGSAKRHPDDKNDEVLGRTLAWARAMRKAAADLEQQAETRIRTRPLLDFDFGPGIGWLR